MDKTKFVTCLIIFFSFILATYAYQVLPSDRVPSHWNAQGKIDGYLPKFWGLFLLPLISLGLFFLLHYLIKIDPLNKNIQKFRKQYNSFILVLIIFFFYIFILTLAANFISIDMTLMLIPALGVLFFYLGKLMRHVKRNWFIGIRTPWTLSNDKVWEKTHKLGSILFQGVGIIMLLSIFFREFLIWLMIVPILISVMWLIIYSYVEYRKIMNHKK